MVATPPLFYYISYFIYLFIYQLVIYLYSSHQWVANNFFCIYVCRVLFCINLHFLLFVFKFMMPVYPLAITYHFIINLLTYGSNFSKYVGAMLLLCGISIVSSWLLDSSPYHLSPSSGPTGESRVTS